MHIAMPEQAQAQSVAKQRRSGKLYWEEARNFYFFISPWLIGFLVFVLFPIGFSFYLSFTSTERSVPAVTDWLVRNWERAVVDGLGIGRFPFLKDTYFDHCTDVLYLRQSPEPSLEVKARAIARELDLPLEIRDVGLGDLERRLIDLVDQPATSA